MRVLVVEDEHKIAAAIKKGLEQERYAVDVAYTGPDGYDLAVTEDYDIILMDIMLPGMDGNGVVGKLRKDSVHTPVLMLTAKSRTADKVRGLDTGADDYLTKPFSFEELLARIRALTRRPKRTTGTTLSAGGLTLDRAGYTVTRGKTPILLSGKEFALLEYLLRHAGQIVSKDRIIAHVWNYDADILPNTVEVYIKNLRAKIDVPFPRMRPLITTVRGFGYKIG